MRRNIGPSPEIISGQLFLKLICLVCGEYSSFLERNRALTPKSMAKNRPFFLNIGLMYTEYRMDDKIEYRMDRWMVPLSG